MANERFVAIEHRLDRVDQMQEAIIQLTNRVDTMHRDLLAIRQPGENQQGYGYGRPRQPQLSKMEFPRYEEDLDILSWLLKCESFFLLIRQRKKIKFELLLFIWMRKPTNGIGLLKRNYVGDCPCGRNMQCFFKIPSAHPLKHLWVALLTYARLVR